MVSKISFLELTKRILIENKKTMTAEEIWDYAIENSYDYLVGSKGKTPWKSFGAQIYVNIRDQNVLLF